MFAVVIAGIFPPESASPRFDTQTLADVHQVTKKVLHRDVRQLRSQGALLDLALGFAEEVHEAAIEEVIRLREKFCALRWLLGEGVVWSEDQLRFGGAVCRSVGSFLTRD